MKFKKRHFRSPALWILCLLPTIFSNAQPSVLGAELKIEHQYKSKMLIVHADDLIKIWRFKGPPVTGYYKHHDPTEMTVDVNGFQAKIPFKDIKKLKRFSNNTNKKLLGQAVTGVGIASLSLGSVALIGGVLALAQDELGALVLVAVPVLGGVGFGLVKWGEHISGRKVRLNRKWKFQLSN